MDESYLSESSITPPFCLCISLLTSVNQISCKTFKKKAENKDKESEMRNFHNNNKLQLRRGSEIRFTFSFFESREKLFRVLKVINVQPRLQSHRRLTIRHVTTLTINSNFSLPTINSEHPYKFYLVFGLRENRGRGRPRPGLLS